MVPKLMFLIIAIQIQHLIGQSPPCHGSYPCISSLTQEDCSARRQIIEMDATISCCPTCRGGLGVGVIGCNPNNVRRLCAPGLFCDEGLCEFNKELCTHTYHLDGFKGLPTCNVDGTFTAKQCKGDKLSGRCFCNSDDGKRIFGWDWWRNSENMTCACSRHRAKLEAAGRIDVTIHCQQNGNYDNLQCDSGICWCADQLTGQPVNGTRIVPDSMWTILPCYDRAVHGDQYLRECESASYAQNLIRKSLAQRGTMDVSFNNVKCDYDGSYGIYSITNGIAACTWRDGKRIGSYQANSNSVGQMNCNCARDQKIFETIGSTLTLSCGGNGNYERVQDLNGKIFCIDDDGFAVTDYFQTAIGLDCRPYLWTEVTVDMLDL